MIREATSSTASGQVGDAVEIGFCVAKLVDGGSVSQRADREDRRFVVSDRQLQARRETQPGNSELVAAMDLLSKSSGVTGPVACSVPLRGDPCGYRHNHLYQFGSSGRLEIFCAQWSPLKFRSNVNRRKVGPVRPDLYFR